MMCVPMYMYVHMTPSISTHECLCETLCEIWGPKSLFQNKVVPTDNLAWGNLGSTEVNLIHSV